MHRFLRSAVNLALTHTYEEGLVFKHCALIVRGGAILAVGFNGSNKNGFVDHISRKAGLHYSVNLHAEVAAILSVRSKIDLTGTKLYVARIRPSGVALSRPCEVCQLAMTRYGISKAVFTIDEFAYGTIKLPQR